MLRLLDGAKLALANRRLVLVLGTTSHKKLMQDVPTVRAQILVSSRALGRGFVLQNLR
jgi:hypothetical protein